uniref:SXP/RAL-2 family protein Ani s 5-like cation-binding domain-containing protein n=1 Tax=Parascaris univalens TaxID=6257 RepID=A0A915CBJ1_PARUN
MYYTNQGRFGRGPKFGFFRICSPWHPLRWWLPDFLKNVSTDGMNNFCDIVRNENLTKAETEQQLNQWSREQGDEVSKTQELIANISKFIDDQEKILRDTSLTSRQEKEQVTAVKLSHRTDLQPRGPFEQNESSGRNGPPGRTGLGRHRDDQKAEEIIVKIWH